MLRRLAALTLLTLSASSAAHADCEGLELPTSYAPEDAALYVFTQGAEATVRLTRPAPDQVEVRVGDACARYAADALSFVFVYGADGEAARVYTAPYALDDDSAPSVASNEARPAPTRAEAGARSAAP